MNFLNKMERKFGRYAIPELTKYIILCYVIGYALEVFQNMMAEKRMTQAIKTAQRNSVITTIWSSATVFSLLINFAVVAVFMDTLNMLKNFF